MAGVITVALVDDDRMLTDGMRSWLGDQPQLRLVSTAATVGRLLEPAPPAAPYAPADVVLLDLRLRDDSTPGENIRRLLHSGSRVLVISTVPDRTQVIASIRAGADGYLTKDNDLPTLVAAIEDVAAGRGAHSPELAFACAHDDSPSRPRLSPRERQVLLDYASGMTLKSAARRAGITVHTAKDYLNRVKAKYRQAGRPTYTKIDLARVVREDSLDDG
ncbi:response regulator transcription factor [Streptomyces sp. P38-E01]|uniref:Response regulator transcription factor n=1 Tax=Streptomyces tardus TaxID=2780544 RepID=A0A949JVG2_9ACTN|nr:response regulator transcription factor [Streptomyces tardus]MBU7600835.1 response regulator transcription factor [Streptomyces tardus]